MPFDGTNVESDYTRVIRQARALIENPDHWCIGITKKLGPYGQVQYCALGALQQAWTFTRVDYPSLISRVAVGATYVGMDPCHANCSSWKVTPTSEDGVRIAGHNNALGHAATLEMFDRAITASMEMDNAVR